MNYTYLLRCADGSLYCGWTNRLNERVQAHNEGKGAKYTKCRRPVLLAYYETFATKEEAMKREAAIKKLTKIQKESLVSSCHEEEKPAFTKNRVNTGTAFKNTMKIIISPAKRMKAVPDEMPWRDRPVYMNEAGILLERLRRFTKEELKELFHANDSITQENYLRFSQMDLSAELTPAVLSYIGIQYQYMAPRIFSRSEWEYICRHLRILSGFYGCLRADDGIVPYRLEMQARLAVNGASDLYGFWKDRIYQALREESDPDAEKGIKKDAVRNAAGGLRILNLASKEYSRAVEAWLQPEDEYVSCVFGTEHGKKVKVKATEAKMARGEMVRFLAERGAKDFETVKEFDRLDFSFCPERSTGKEYVFIKRKKDDSITD